MKVGFTCPMCGVVFRLKSRFEAHREAEIPTFSAAARIKNQAAAEAFLDRQRAIGRLREDGSWNPDWRPEIEG